MNDRLTRQVVRAVFACSLLPAAAGAQTGIYLEPSVAVFQGYDDNLYYTFDNEEGDRITRVTPALDAGYESERLNWSGRYSFDAEDYANNPELDSLLVRRFADLAFEYLPTSRLTLSGTAIYTKTRTPLDLTLSGGGVPGLLIGRVGAERTVLRPAMSYRVSDRTTGLLAHTLTQDRLENGINSDVHMTELTFTSRLSATDTLDYGYLHRRYSFSNLSTADSLAAMEQSQDSHTPWAGWSHDFSARVNLVARAGPRIYEDSIDPYLLVTLARTHERGQLAVSYESNETTLLGEVGRVETETLSATLTHRFGEKLEVQLIPAVAHVSRGDFAVKIYRASLNASYAFNDRVSLTATYDYNFQRVDFSGTPSASVSRSVVMLGITVMLPGRTRRRQAATAI